MAGDKMDDQVLIEILRYDNNPLMRYAAERIEALAKNQTGRPTEEPRQPKIFFEADLAKELGLSYSTVRRMRLEEGLPHMMTGNRPLYRIDSVMEWFSEREKASSMIGAGTLRVIEPSPHKKKKIVPRQKTPQKKMPSPKIYNVVKTLEEAITDVHNQNGYRNCIIHDTKGREYMTADRIASEVCDVPGWDVVYVTL